MMSAAASRPHRCHCIEQDCLPATITHTMCLTATGLGATTGFGAAAGLGVTTTAARLISGLGAAGLTGITAARSIFAAGFGSGFGETGGMTASRLSSAGLTVDGALTVVVLTVPGVGSLGLAGEDGTPVSVLASGVTGGVTGVVVVVVLASPTCVLSTVICEFNLAISGASFLLLGSRVLSSRFSLPS